ncbi:MAG: metal ABC transporter permease [Verrucomicrobia bacterium]|nr:metal ABC transporter permease [Verrucomicrobiota bacterium]
MIEALLTHSFLYMAILAGIAGSVTGGIMGSFVVVKRIVFISGSIAHSILGGMGLFLWIHRTFDIAWITPFQGAIVAAILSALLIGWIHLEYQQREDTVIAALWSTGMSIGVIFIALTPGYNVELMHYLFGNILWVTKSDVFTLIALDMIVIAIVALFRHQFLAICFDEQQAKLQKVPVKFFYLLLLCLVAISVVLLIQVVGAILVIAMLAIPAAIAANLTRKFTSMMILAVIIGSLFSIFGTAVAYQLNWPPGATIALVATLFYLISFRLRLRSLKVQ